MENHGLSMSEYLLAAPTASEMTKLAEECNLSATSTLCFLTNDPDETPSVFKKVTSPNNVIHDLGQYEGVTRIIISPTAELAVAYCEERNWQKSSWEGLIMPHSEEVHEYQKVYPQYTSTE